MNDCIEKFARECGAWNQVYGNRTFMIDEHFDIERFAELIVRECMSICERGVVSNSDYFMGRTHCALDLTEHFGVEE